MSLLNTLGKVAIGIAAYKGLKNMVDRENAAGGPASRSGGGIADSLTRMARPRSGSPLDSVIGSLSRPGANGQTGLDRILAGFGGKGGGALLGGILGGLGGGMAGSGMGGTSGGSMSGSMSGGAVPPAPPAAPAPDAGSAEEEAVAALLLRAMIQGAKADGEIDAEERRRILGTLDDAHRSDLDFLMAEMAAPVDPEALARATPPGLEAQVYGAALFAITADTEGEHGFLDRLGRGLGLSAERRAEIAAAPPVHA